MRSSSKPSQFFSRVNCQNVDINHKPKYKSHECVNRNIFSCGIAVVTLLFFKRVSVVWLLTGPNTVHRLNKPGCGQSRFKKCQFVPSLLAKSSYSKQVINKTAVVNQE